MNKKALLSIGEMSKLTGAGIKALRYYDEVNILKPAYVDPDSGYRYYSYNQTYLVGLIMFCVELDISLKELSWFADGQDTMDFKAFLAYGKKEAHKKRKTLDRGLGFIDFFEQNIALQERYALGQIYTKKLPQKSFYVLPYEQTFENVNQYEVEKLYFDVPYYEENEWLEHGYLCQYSPSGVNRYIFAEMPRDKANDNCMAIPAGLYYCRQSDAGQIEQAKEIFADFLSNNTSFIAIETEVISGKLNINKPVNELRVCPVQSTR